MDGLGITEFLMDTPWSHCLRNNSWKAYCIVNFNMGWQI
jgi:hypothetical protein